MRAVALEFLALALCLAGAQGARHAPAEEPGAIIKEPRVTATGNRRLLQVPTRLPPPPSLLPGHAPARPPP